MSGEWDSRWALWRKVVEQLDLIYERAKTERYTIGQRRRRRIARSHAERGERSRRPLTPAERTAIELHESGAVKSLADGFRLQGVRNAERSAVRVGRLKTDEVGQVREEARSRTHALIQSLVVQKVEAAEEGIRAMRTMLADTEISPELKVKIAQDFLDRVTETSKISKQEINATGVLQLPEGKADHLLNAIARASAAASRPLTEVQWQDRLPPAEPVAALPVPSETFPERDEG